MPPDTFAVRLIQLRKAKGWTQAEAATSCGVDDGSWSNWENGARPRQMDEIVNRISAATDADRDWLMWGSRSRCSRLASVEDFGQAELPFPIARYLSAV